MHRKHELYRVGADGGWKRGQDRKNARRTLKTGRKFRDAQKYDDDVNGTADILRLNLEDDRLPKFLFCFYTRIEAEPKELCIYARLLNTYRVFIYTRGY